MSNDTNKPEPRKKISLGSKKLRGFFLSHLDKIYSAKAHLVNHLPTIKEEAHFADLKIAVRETIEDVERQMARMEVIYELLDSSPNNANCGGLAGLVDDAFEDIKKHAKENELRDMSIVFYLQNIESLEMASFQVLQMAAVKLRNKQIKQLLRENYDEAKADRTLLLLIGSKYIVSSTGS
ncbi:DUF892 family protein [Mucilaginibacter terrenus]|uniref:DUF892 family protein n=1 Tax=Mucilaginibacter terrenus TaxID=2482727 RepID=A0A3E2NXT9_9SPHI|nr:DUF892 family protein [Mucilaginibacter terrenus]RFZ85835.1 DUF892 family protein [Mucilaginibacter terrenus]